MCALESWYAGWFSGNFAGKVFRDRRLHCAFNMMLSECWASRAFCTYGARLFGLLMCLSCVCWWCVPWVILIVIFAGVCLRLNWDWGTSTVIRFPGVFPWLHCMCMCCWHRALPPDNWGVMYANDVIRPAMTTGTHALPACSTC